MTDQQFIINSQVYKLIPLGFCACGCGQGTTIASETIKDLDGQKDNQKDLSKVIILEVTNAVMIILCGMVVNLFQTDI